MIKKKRAILSTAVLLTVLAAVFLCGGCVKKTYDDGYGVYIGVDDIDRLKKLSSDDDVIVVEGQSFTAEQIAELKSDGKTVYSYLNVGSLETYRPYYPQFKSLAIDRDDNWPDEYWIDVSDRSWQEYISGIVAKELWDKGVDGFFIDNCDVYYVHDEMDDMYDALLEITKTLKGYGADVIVNGGDVFVKRLMDENRTDIIDGVNQECVFSFIEDYDRDVFGSQDSAETLYYTDYLAEVKAAGLRVFLLEYTKDEKVREEIDSYCRDNGFRYFISQKLSLDGNPG